MVSLRALCRLPRIRSFGEVGYEWGYKIYGNGRDYLIEGPQEEELVLSARLEGKSLFSKGRYLLFNSNSSNPNKPVNEFSAREYTAEQIDQMLRERALCIRNLQAQTCCNPLLNKSSIKLVKRLAKRIPHPTTENVQAEVNRYNLEEFFKGKLVLR